MQRKKMFFLPIMVLLGIMLLVQNSLAQVQRPEPLNKEQMTELAADALEEYRMAEVSYDKTLYAETMDHLKKSSDLDPRHIPLQFLMVRISIQMARAGRGVSLYGSVNESLTDTQIALGYYKMARDANQRILDTLGLPDDLFDRAENLARVIEREGSIEEIELREARRMDASYRFLVEHAAEIYPDDSPAGPGSVEELEAGAAMRAEAAIKAKEKESGNFGERAVNSGGNRGDGAGF